MQLQKFGHTSFGVIGDPFQCYQFEQGALGIYFEAEPACYQAHAGPAETFRSPLGLHE